MSDTNGNGVDDSIEYDMNSDGYAETLLWDANGDGRNDNIQVDTNIDGVADTMGVDVDGDAAADYVAGPETGGQWVAAAPAAPTGISDPGTIGGGGPFMTTPAAPTGIGDPGIIGGGFHNSLIDIIPLATPSQLQQINTILDTE